MSHILVLNNIILTIILLLSLLVLVLQILWDIAAIYDERIVVNVDVLYCLDVQDGTILV